MRSRSRCSVTSRVLSRNSRSERKRPLAIKSPRVAFVADTSSTSTTSRSPSHGTNGPVVQEFEEDRLKGDRHVADLVQEQRTPVGLAKEPHRSALPRARERALHVAEQFRFNQALRQRCAVDRDECARPATGPRRRRDRTRVGRSRDIAPWRRSRAGRALGRDRSTAGAPRGGAPRSRRRARMAQQVLARI